MHYDQGSLIKKIEQYLAIKNASGYKLDFNLKEGICAGLVAYWLYSIANDEEGRFVDKIEHALNWDADKFKKSSHKIDLKLEELINVIFLLHNPRIINNQINQFNLNTAFPIILNSSQASILEPEFKITFTFTKQSLHSLLEQCVFPNKMIRLGNGIHAMGLILKDKQYKLYDPDHDKLIQYFDHPQNLAVAIFNAFAAKTSAKNYVAINATIFDLEDSVRPDYISPLDFCNNLLQSKNYKSDSLNDKYIFNLCSKYDEYAIMDLLFANGYKYIPWQVNKGTELNDAVYNHDLKKAEYLLSHDIPVDYKSSFGVTPLHLAIEKSLSQMVFMLLNAGANPNGDSTYLSLALNNKFSDGVILLLAYGLNVSEEEVDEIKTVFPDEAADIIFSGSIKLNEKIFKMPKELDLENSSGKDIIKFLHNAQLKQQLGYAADLATVNNIKEIYKTDHTCSILNVTEKEDAYEVLKYFDPELAEFGNEEEEKQEFDHLSALLQKITVKITSKAIHEHSKSDLLEIQILLEKIAELKLSTDKDLGAEALAAEDAIHEYLSNNKVKTIHHKKNNLFFILNKPEDKSPMSYEQDIAQNLPSFKAQNQ